MNFVITSNQILGFCGLITTLYAVYKIIKEIKKPSDDLKKKVESHEAALNKDFERLNEIEDSNKMILKCMLEIINHDITGNGISKLKETRDELQEFLIKK